MKNYLPLVFILISIILINCSNSDDPVNNHQSNPEGELSPPGGCKNEIVLLRNDSNCYTIAEYYYSDDNVLFLDHINAGFNCCPGEFKSNFTFRGDTILVETVSTEKGCYCECLYDLNFKITDLKKGSYYIKIISGLDYQYDEDLEFAINLKEKTSGRISIERKNYPWCMP